MDIYFETADQLPESCRLVWASYDLAPGQTITVTQAVQEARDQLDANEVASWPLGIVSYAERHAYFDVLAASDLEITEALAFFAE